MRRFLGSLALVVGGVAFALVAAELAVRLTWSRFEPRAPASPAPPPAELRGLPELEGVQGLRRPRVRGVYKGVLHRTNSLGVRGPEYSLRPPAGVFRIVVTGDSVTMGQGVAEADTYPAVLERLLREDGRRVEVVNLGVSGLNILHAITRLRKVGLRYAPDLIVYGFTLNDIEGPHYVANTKRAQAARVHEAMRFAQSPSRLLRVLWPRLVLQTSALWPAEGSYEYTLVRNYVDSPEAWGQIGEGLDRLARIADARGVCANVFIHARLSQLRLLHPFDRIYGRVGAAALERGLSVTQSIDTLRGHDAETLRFSFADPHPNEAGHRLLAEALRDGLEALPSRCWQDARLSP